MKSLSPRQLSFWLSGAPEVEHGRRVGRTHSRSKQAVRWFMGTSLILLLAYGQTLSCQATAPKGKNGPVDDLFFSPFAVAVDGSGNVYIDDSYNYRVLKETPSGGSYTQSVVVCCDLSNSSGVAVDGSGNV